MSAVDQSLVQYIMTQGVAIGVLIWFMTRMEKKLEEQTKKFGELCDEIKKFLSEKA